MRRIVYLILVFCFMLSGSVQAITNDQRKAIQTGVYYFNTEADANCRSAENATALVGNDAQEKIYRFFLQKGLSKEQAAGVTGNAYTESRYDPLSQSASFQGLFQWDKAVRWKRLVEFANTSGRNPNDLDTQLDFAFNEATQRGNIEGIKTQNTVELATWYWGRFFEVAVVKGSTDKTPLKNVQKLDERTTAARQTLTLYGGDSEGAQTDPNTPAPVSASDTFCTGIGEDTQFAEGFTFYSQYDPQWKDKPFGVVEHANTIGSAGCGPTSMAMIITNLLGRSVTPAETASYANDKHQYQDVGGGSKGTLAPVLAEHWGLKSQAIPRDAAAITAALQAGQLIIISGKGGVPYTSEGHIIVIRAATADGKWRIADPAFELPEHKGVNEKDWEPQQIITSARDGSVYAISK